MRTVLAFSILFFISSCGNKVKETPKEPEPKPIEVKNYSIEDFYKSTSVGGGSFSQDNSKMLISSNESGIYNIYEIDIASGEQTQLSFSTKETLQPIDYMPNGQGVLYAADKGGNEIQHIYLLKDGESTDLTPEENAKAGFRAWNKDRTAFYYSTNKRDPKFLDIYKMNIASLESTLVYENDGEWNYAGMSKKEVYMALSKSISNSDSRLMLRNRQTGAEILVSDEDKKGEYNAAGFSKDGQWFYYTTDADGEFKKVMKLNLETGEKLDEFATDWDVSYYAETKKGTYRICGVNNDGRNVITVSTIATGEKLAIPTIEGAELLSVGFSQDEKMMRLTIGTSKGPSNLYSYHLESKTLKKLTNTQNPDINEADMAAAQVIRFKSFDGLEIPAVYYKPLNATANHKVPAMLFIHGGPGGQTKVGYRPVIQYMVNQGYAVLAVNNRGSSGYGKTFYNADNQNHGDKDLKDCIWGKKWLQEQDYIDAEKIGILGGSYGGFMTMAAMAFAPNEFKVGVNLFGVTNWLRTLNSIPPYWESFRKTLYDEMGDPATDSLRLYNISPLFHADKIKNPVMVLQGANDPRVLQVESDEMVANMKEHNVPVEYVLFDDEGHGFRKKENEIMAYGKIVEFLDKYLKEETAAEVGSE